MRGVAVWHRNAGEVSPNLERDKVLELAVLALLGVAMVLFVFRHRASPSIASACMCESAARQRTPIRSEVER